jgi:hypothetical protein
MSVSVSNLAEEPYWAKSKGIAPVKAEYVAGESPVLMAQLRSTGSCYCKTVREVSHLQTTTLLNLVHSALQHQERESGDLQKRNNGSMQGIVEPRSRLGVRITTESLA